MNPFCMLIATTVANLARVVIEIESIESSVFSVIIIILFQGTYK